MAITASELQIVIRGTLLAQRIEVVQWYRPTGSAFLTADPVAVGEAYWNDIKTSWRACHVPTAVDLTQSIFVSEPGSTGAYGEFAIPAGEQQGTRDVSGTGGLMPPYVAVAVRETVATRVTRPGQKRFWGVNEGDNTDGVLGGALQALVETLMAKFDSTITLGAPVATGVLDPIVVHIDRSTGLPTASQLVTGHVINTNLSTQNSRKIGRGA